MSYTEGPWKVFEGDRFGIDGHDGTAVIFFASKEDSQYVGVNGNTERERTANAHLISAAPELLEALEKLLPEAINDRYNEQSHAVYMARAAIAKARGASHD